MTIRRLLAALSLSAFLAPAAALAVPACDLPPNLVPAPVLQPRPQEIEAGRTTAYYLLTLSWAPQWCATMGQGTTSQAIECNGHFGFILHGLWPDAESRPDPRYCRTVGGLDPATLRSMYCRTPSAELLQHEWQAHGACGWPEARAYFARASKLYDRIKVPKIETIPQAALTAGALRRAFVAANPWLKPQMVFVQTEKTGRLSELRVCYDLAFEPSACPGGNGARDDRALILTPSAARAF